jgi:hypothetical protein
LFVISFVTASLLDELGPFRWAQASTVMETPEENIREFRRDKSLA